MNADASVLVADDLSEIFIPCDDLTENPSRLPVLQPDHLVMIRCAIQGRLECSAYNFGRQLDPSVIDALQVDMMRSPVFPLGSTDRRSGSKQG